MDVIRPLAWVGAAKKELKRFPPDVVHEFGYRLYRVQEGQEAPGEKLLTKGPLKGLGIRELRLDFDHDTYRVVYTVRLGNAIYVLHAFKKKSNSGISTPAHVIDLLRERYLEAVQLDEVTRS